MNASSEFLGDPQITPNDTFSGYVLMADNGVSRLGTISRYDRRFFVKSIVPQYADTHLYRLQLRKEFKMLMELNHPNIVRVYELCEIPEIGFSILMEFLQGENLSQYLDHDSSRSERRRIADNIVDALAYVHSKGVIHGDLKPGNIMINTQNCAVKLIDFGLSDTEDFTLLKIPGGTRDFLPPESNNPGYRVSMRSDVYSLGKVIKSLNAGMPYKWAVRRACSSNPDKRFADASLFKRAIRAYRNFTSWIIGLLAALVIIAAIWMFSGSGEETVAKNRNAQDIALADVSAKAPVENNSNDEKMVDADQNLEVQPDKSLDAPAPKYSGGDKNVITTAEEEELMHKLEMAQNNAYANGLARLAAMERIRTNNSLDLEEKVLRMREELLNFYRELRKSYQEFSKEIPAAMYEKYGYDWNTFVSWPAVSLYSKGVDMLAEFVDDNKLPALTDN